MLCGRVDASTFLAAVEHVLEGESPGDMRNHVKASQSPNIIAIGKKKNVDIQGRSICENGFCNQYFYFPSKAAGNSKGGFQIQCSRSDISGAVRNVAYQFFPTMWARPG